MIHTPLLTDEQIAKMAEIYRDKLIPDCNDEREWVHSDTDFISGATDARKIYEADRSRLLEENRLLMEALGEARRFVENDRMDSLTSHRDAWAAAARKCVLRIDALLTPARTEPGSLTQRTPTNPDAR